MAARPADEWEVELSERAELDYSNLPDDIQQEASELLDELRWDPFPQGHLQMRRYNDVYRLRMANDRFRVVYRVDRRNRLVKVFRLRPRGTAYAGLKSPRH